VPCDASFVVGDMLEHLNSNSVAECPNVFLVVSRYSLIFMKLWSSSCMPVFSGFKISALDILPVATITDSAVNSFRLPILAVSSDERLNLSFFFGFNCFKTCVIPFVSPFRSSVIQKFLVLLQAIDDLAFVVWWFLCRCLRRSAHYSMPM